MGSDDGTSTASLGRKVRSILSQIQKTRLPWISALLQAVRQTKLQPPYIGRQRDLTTLQKLSQSQVIAYRLQRIMQLNLQLNLKVLRRIDGCSIWRLDLLGYAFANRSKQRFNLSNLIPQLLDKVSIGH